MIDSKWQKTLKYLIAKIYEKGKIFHKPPIYRPGYKSKYDSINNGEGGEGRQTFQKE